MHEGGYPGGKTRRFSARFSYFRQFSRARLTELPMSVFDDLGVPGKLVIPSSLKFWTCEILGLGSRGTVPRIEATRVFFPCQKAVFQSRFRPNQGKS